MDPERLGPFEIVGRLGVGGMAVVFEGVDRETGQSVAIKCISASIEKQHRDLAARKLHEEAQALARLGGGHAPILYRFESGPPPWLAMELLRGETLEGWLAKGPLPVSEGLSVLLQVAQAVAQAHAAQLVHRDLKPENVFVAHSQLYFHPRLVKVIDWGIVADLSRDQGRTMMFTKHYAAPEQHRHQQATAQSDIFNFGLLAFHCLAGHAYFDDASAARFAWDGEAQRPGLPSQRLAAAGLALPRGKPGFDDWFMTCTAHDSRARYPSMAEAVSELGRACGYDVRAAGITQPMTNLLELASPRDDSIALPAAATEPVTRASRAPAVQEGRAVVVPPQRGAERASDPAFYRRSGTPAVTPLAPSHEPQGGSQGWQRRWGVATAVIVGAGAVGLAISQGRARAPVQSPGASPFAAPPIAQALEWDRMPVPETPFTLSGSREPFSGPEFQVLRRPVSFSDLTGSAKDASRRGSPADAVTGVTFNDAEAYCNKLQATLPTEAQWEYVAVSYGQRSDIGQRFYEWTQSDYRLDAPYSTLKIRVPMKVVRGRPPDPTNPDPAPPISARRPICATAECPMEAVPLLQIKDGSISPGPSAGHLAAVTDALTRFPALSDALAACSTNSLVTLPLTLTTVRTDCDNQKTAIAYARWYTLQAFPALRECVRKNCKACVSEIRTEASGDCDYQGDKIVLKPDPTKVQSLSSGATQVVLESSRVETGFSAVASKLTFRCVKPVP